jgi:hypothetical protein
LFITVGDGSARADVRVRVCKGPAKVSKTGEVWQSLQKSETEFPRAHNLNRTVVMMLRFAVLLLVVGSVDAFGPRPRPRLYSKVRSLTAF